MQDISYQYNTYYQNYSREQVIKGRINYKITNMNKIYENIVTTQCERKRKHNNRDK